MHTYIHTHIHTMYVTYIHTYIHTYIRTQWRDRVAWDGIHMCTLDRNDMSAPSPKSASQSLHTNTHTSRLLYANTHTYITFATRKHTYIHHHHYTQTNNTQTPQLTASTFVAAALHPPDPYHAVVTGRGKVALVRPRRGGSVLNGCVLQRGRDRYGCDAAIMGSTNAFLGHTVARVGVEEKELAIGRSGGQEPAVWGKAAAQHTAGRETSIIVFSRPPL